MLWWNINLTSKGFRKLTSTTLVAVYFLILVGGIVRSTGSGMGCPDWPTCFGQWVPPVSESQLPDDYRQQYADYRHEKNVRFAKYLKAFGMEDTATRLLEDESVRTESVFNATKTWVEYANRLVGVTIGFFIIMVTVSSVQFWKQKRWLTVLALLSLLLVIFQGWIGSVVVSTNLTPWTVTLHMILALVLVCMLVILYEFSGAASQASGNSQTIWLSALCLILLFIQIIWGTGVREEIDRIAAELSNRNEWISALGSTFIRHRSFSWIVLIVNAALVVKLWKSGRSNTLSLVVIVLILGAVISGAGMAWFGVPPVLQPIHLLITTAAFGLQFLLLVQWLRPAKKETGL